VNEVRNYLLLGIFLLLTSCVKNISDNVSTDINSKEFDFVGMMANYADGVIIPSYERLDTSIKLLGQPGGSIDNYCSSIGSADEFINLELARTSWLTSMSNWQEIETYLIGPIMDNGGSIRNSIYSFFSGSPLSTCAIDQAVVLAEDPTFDLNSRSFNQRGLDALEYLLFNDNLDHTCPAQINETQTWNARSETERRQLRCDYALDLGDDVGQAVDGLMSSWQPGGENFRSDFVNPSNLSTYFQELADALFYIELKSKDAKLGIPTGIKSDCSQITCPESVESPYSDTSLENIRANLVGFREFLTGGSGLGFDDIIIQEGFSSVVDNFHQNIEIAIDLIDSMDSSLVEQLDQLVASGDDSSCLNSAANPDSVQEIPACSLHGFLKRITDSLRTEFIVIVNVDLPDTAAGDND